MDKNEIINKLNGEIGSINFVLNRLAKIYDRNPDSVNAQDASYAINVLTNVKNNITKISNEMKKEIDSQQKASTIEDESVLSK